MTASDAAESEAAILASLSRVFEIFADGDPDNDLQALEPTRRALAARFVRAGRPRTPDDPSADKIAEDLTFAAWVTGQVIHAALRRPDYVLRVAGEERTALMHEAFAAAQLQGNGPVSDALRRAALRTAAGPELASTVAAWEAALQELAALDGDFAAAVAVGDDLEGLANRAAALRAAIAGDEALIAAGVGGASGLLAPTPVAVTDLTGAGTAAALLGPDEALILLAPSPGKARGRVWAVTRDRLATAEIGAAGDGLSAGIARFHAMLAPPMTITRAPVSPGGASSSVRPFDMRLSHELYLTLFGDPQVKDVIEDKSRWILVPQGALLSMPFAALTTAAPDEAGPVTAASLRAAPWLGTGRALAVLPTVAALHNARVSPVAADPGRLAYLGLGDPDFLGAPGPLRGIDPTALADAERRIDAVRGLPRLPATRHEVETLSQSYAPAAQITLTGAAASEAGLATLDADGSLGRAAVLHFATHGLLAGAAAGLDEPALALTPPSRPMPLGAGRIDDGLLLASEIAGLRLAADWVVLSACNTAAGNSAGAEGLSGLARAFFYAGARALLVTHWSVEDEAAARLVGDTLRAHATGVPRAVALQRAMAAMVADRSRDATAMPLSHPGLWAPFQVIGTPD